MNSFCIFSDYASASSLNEHKKTVHETNRNFPCQECQFAFKRYCQLKKHVRRVHQKLRTATCHLCGETFRRNFDLKTHLLRHSGLKPFCCELCGKSFLRKGALQRHRAIHDGVVRYQCHFCGKGFNRGDSYKSHLKRNHGEEAVPLNHKNSHTMDGHEYYVSRVIASAGEYGSRIPGSRMTKRRKPLHWSNQTNDNEEEMLADESVKQEEQIEIQEATDNIMADDVVHAAQLEELGDCTIGPGEFFTVKIVSESGSPQLMLCPVKK